MKLTVTGNRSSWKIFRKVKDMDVDIKENHKEKRENIKENAKYLNEEAGLGL